MSTFKASSMSFDIHNIDNSLYLSCKFHPNRTIEGNRGMTVCFFKNMNTCIAEFIGARDIKHAL